MDRRGCRSAIRRRGSLDPSWAGCPLRNARVGVAGIGRRIDHSLRNSVMHNMCENLLLCRVWLARLGRRSRRSRFTTPTPGQVNGDRKNWPSESGRRKADWTLGEFELQSLCSGAESQGKSSKNAALSMRAVETQHRMAALRHPVLLHLQGLLRRARSSSRRQVETARIRLNTCRPHGCGSSTATAPRASQALNPRDRRHATQRGDVIAPHGPTSP